MRFALITHQLTGTNLDLVGRGWPNADSELLEPKEALRRLVASDVALSRLDVFATIAGVEEGLWIVGPRFGSWGRDVEMCSDKAALNGAVEFGRSTRRRPMSSPPRWRSWHDRRGSSSPDRYDEVVNGLFARCRPSP
jgi:hypothetical protein